MSILIISGRPLNEWILELASADARLREHAGEQLYLYISDLKSAEEYHRLREMENPERHPFPMPELKTKLQSAVPAVFELRGFPVVPTVQALASGILQKSQRVIGMLGATKGREQYAELTPFENWSINVVLEAIGPAAAPAIPILIDLLQAQAGNDHVSYCGHVWIAARALGSMGKAGTPGFNALLSSYCESTSDDCLAALIRIASESDDALRMTREAANDSAPKRRWLALKILGEVLPCLGGVRDVFLRALNDPDSQVRLEAARMLRRHFADDALVRVALEQKSGPNAVSNRIPPVQPWVREGVTLHGWLEILAGGDESRREHALNMLLSMYYGFNDIPGDNSDFDWRRLAPAAFMEEAARIYSDPEFPAARVTIALIKILREYFPRDSHHMHKRLLSNLIQCCGQSGSAPIEDLIALVDEDFHRGVQLLSETGTLALAKLGAPALIAYPNIFNKAVATHGRQYPNHFANVMVQWAKTYDSVVAKLIAELSGNELRQRITAAAILGQLGPRAGPALATALQIAERGDAGFEKVVVPIFTATASISAAARDYLLRFTSHADVDTRAAALASLARFPEMAEVLPTLERGLSDEDPFVRWRSLCGICDSPLSDDSKVSYCIRMLNDFDGHDHWIPAYEAVKRLAKLGVAAAPAVAKIINAGSDEEPGPLLTILENVGPVAARPALPWLKERLQEALNSDPLKQRQQTVRIERLVLASS